MRGGCRACIQELEIDYGMGRGWAVSHCDVIDEVTRDGEGMWRRLRTVVRRKAGLVLQGTSCAYADSGWRLILE